MSVWGESGEELAIHLAAAMQLVALFIVLLIHRYLRHGHGQGHKLKGSESEGCSSLELAVALRVVI